ncbi:MAG: tRNA-dihydrouridine synthase [Candidatus Pacebacteria bacterium]|nr:tRNA-dihydrouridine synthase [Candidatus Paceibacterota bacterium]
MKFLKNLFKKKQKYRTDGSDIVMGFWDKLPEDFVIMAPMADVTDSAFREIIAKYSRHGEAGGGPDVFYTEFVASDGLNNDKGRPKLMHNFKYTENERPIVAQIFSCHPENIEYAARLCRELGFDGIDLNMGCPERNICKQGAGCGMIKTPELLRPVIEAAKRGAGDIPVAVKTRVGWSKNEIETWIPAILDCDVAALILHGRTRKVMSKVPANWDWIQRAGEIVRESGKPTKFIGNGDLQSVAQAKEYCKKYGTDGGMIARAIFGNPWLFDTEKTEVSVEEKLRVMIEHTEIFVRDLIEHKNFHVMKKHYKAYVAGFDGAKELRVQLMESNSIDDIKDIVKKWLKDNPETAKIMIPC